MRKVQLRQKIEEFEGQYNIRLNRETIVRTVAYLSCQERGGPIRIEKKTILEDLDAGDFHRHWDWSCDLYRMSLEHLIRQHFVLNRD